MRKRSSFVLMLVFAGLISNAGCLSLFPKHDDQRFPVSGKSKGKKADSVLPAGESAEACLTTAQALEQNGHFLQAAIQYELARRYDPQLKNISRRLAVLYDRCGKIDQALVEYQHALKENPNDVNLLNNFGYHYYTRGKLKEAEEMYRKALKINDQHHVAWTNLGLVLAQQGRFDESRKTFERVVSPAEALCNLAFIYTARGERAKAKKAYQEALVQQPTLQKARLALQKLEESDESTAGQKEETPFPVGRPKLETTSVKPSGHTPVDLQLPEELPGVTTESAAPDLSPINVPTPGQTRELIGS